MSIAIHAKMKPIVPNAQTFISWNPIIQDASAHALKKMVWLFN